MSISDGEFDGAISKFFAPRLAAKEREKALAALYGDPGFRQALKILKRMIPQSSSLRDPRVKQVFLSRTRMILSRWGLHRFPHHAAHSYKWMAWLWRHWDPDSGGRPILPATIREPQLAHWTLHYLESPLNFAADESRHSMFQNAWVTVTFFPGISSQQAMKAAKAALKLANLPWGERRLEKNAGGRPGATAYEVDAFFEVFEQVGLPGKAQGQRQADKLRRIRKTIEDSSEQSINSLRRWSDSAIANHYRKWRANKGAPPRRYYKEPTGD